MRTGDWARSCGQRAWRGASIGPQSALLASVAVAGAIVAPGLLPTNLLMPVVSTLLFVLALVSALVAWVRCSTDEYRMPHDAPSGARS